MLGQVSSLQVPAVHVSALRNEREQGAEIIGTSGHGDSWLDREGGTVIVKSPAGGAHVLVTAYGLPAQAVSVPDIQVRRLDRPRSNDAAPRSRDPAGHPEEIRSEIVLHVERLGDRRFPGEGWVGNRGKKLRIEAFSIRPVDTLLARDIVQGIGSKGAADALGHRRQALRHARAGASVDRVCDPSGAACSRAIRCRLPGRLLRERRCGSASQWRTLYSTDYRRPAGGDQCAPDPTVSPLGSAASQSPRKRDTEQCTTHVCTMGALRCPRPS